MSKVIITKVVEIEVSPAIEGRPAVEAQPAIEAVAEIPAQPSREEPVLDKDGNPEIYKSGEKKGQTKLKRIAAVEGVPAVQAREAIPAQPAIEAQEAVYREEEQELTVHKVDFLEKNGWKDLGWKAVGEFDDKGLAMEVRSEDLLERKAMRED